MVYRDLIGRVREKRETDRKEKERQEKEKERQEKEKEKVTISSIFLISLTDNANRILCTLGKKIFRNLLMTES